jgi:hypothetical protein
MSLSFHYPLFAVLFSSCEIVDNFYIEKFVNVLVVNLSNGGMKCVGWLEDQNSHKMQKEKIVKKTFAFTITP